MVTTDKTIESMIAAAGAGRGLWIGLFHERSPRHELLCIEIEEINGDAVTLMRERPHVTLAHLGKHAGRREVEAAVTACHILSEINRATNVGVECVARFTSHVVAVLAHRWLDSVADQVVKCLADHHVFPDVTFAGVRHVTLAQVKRGERLSRIPATPRYDLRFSTMAAVCGGHQMSFALLAQAPELF